MNRPRHLPSAQGSGILADGGGTLSGDGLTPLVAIGEPVAASVCGELRLGSGYLGRPTFQVPRT